MNKQASITVIRIFLGLILLAAFLGYVVSATRDNATLDEAAVCFVDGERIPWEDVAGYLPEAPDTYIGDTGRNIIYVWHRGTRWLLVNSDLDGNVLGSTILTKQDFQWTVQNLKLILVKTGGPR